MRGGNTLENYMEGLSNALPADSSKLLLCATRSMSNSDEGIKINNQFMSKALSYGFVAYSTTVAAAKCCFRLWEYGQYLKKLEKIANN